MANNYTESSSHIKIPEASRKQAEEIMERVAAELISAKQAEDEAMYTGADEAPDADEYPAQDDEEYSPGYVAELDNTGVWIHHDESINMESVEKLVRALVEELDLPGVYVCSWAETCSRPRVDEFGGGAFALQKGQATVWVDASAMALNHLHRLAAATENERLTAPAVKSGRLPEPTPEQAACKHESWRTFARPPRNCPDCGLQMWDAGD